MKNIVLAGIALFAAGSMSYAANVQTNRERKYISPEERAAKKAQLSQMRMESFGGMIARPNTQKGEVFFVNCQKRVPKAWIDELVGYFADETLFKVSYKEGAFDFASPKIEGNASLFIIDDAKMPAILFAPENRWAFVNIAVIAKEERPAFFEARVKKQLSRGFALLCGASNSQYPNALTRGIVDEADLDKNIDYILPVDLFQRFVKYMEPLGVRPEIKVSYRKACQEGWAPAPTNEFQKAVWDKVHAMPTTPIKIKPETKKVKE